MRQDDALDPANRNHATLTSIVSKTEITHRKPRSPKTLSIADDDIRARAHV